jgi:hypothetical protein
LSYPGSEENNNLEDLDVDVRIRLKFLPPLGATAQGELWLPE